MPRDVKVGIIVEGKDKGASAVLSNVGGQLKALPEQFGKSATALLLFQNATSQMGGKVADAANKISAIAGLAATGGPLGIAIAAATGAVGAATYAWDQFTLESDAAARSVRQTAKTMQEAAKRTQEYRKDVERLREELRFLGVDQREREIVTLKEKIEIVDTERARMEASIAVLKKRKEAEDNVRDALKGHRQAVIDMVVAGKLREQGLETLTEEERAHLETEQKALALLNSKLAVERDRLGVLEATRKKEEEIDRARKAREARALQHQQDLSAAIERAKAQNEAYFANQKAWDERIDAFAARRIDEQDENANNYEKRSRDIDATITSWAENQASQWTSVGSSIGNVLGLIVSGSIDAQNAAKEMAKSIASSLISMAIETVRAQAVRAAAAAYADSVEKLGVAGIAAGAIAATAALTAVQSIIQQLADGGFVRGGTPGRDSVPVVAMPGEYMMSVGEVAGMRKFLGRLLDGRRADMGVAMAGAGAVGGGGYVDNSRVQIVNQMVYPDRTASQRLARRQSQIHLDLRKRRVIP